MFVHYVIYYMPKYIQHLVFVIWMYLLIINWHNPLDLNENQVYWFYTIRIVMT